MIPYPFKFSVFQVSLLLLLRIQTSATIRGQPQLLMKLIDIIRYRIRIRVTSSKLNAFLTIDRLKTRSKIIEQIVCLRLAIKTLIVHIPATGTFPQLLMRLRVRRRRRVPGIKNVISLFCEDGLASLFIALFDYRL